MTLTEYDYDLIKFGYEYDAEFIKKLLLSLNYIQDEMSCDVCSTVLSFQNDSSRSMGIRLWCKTCKSKQGIRKFTPFKSLKLDIVQILRIIILFIENKSMEEIINDTFLSKPTILKVIKMIRISIMKYLDTNYEKLGKEGIVEIDETLSAKKRKSNRGRIKPQQWIAGGIERGTGLIFMKTVEKRDKETLGKLINQFIDESATVYSDEWRAYRAYFLTEGTQTHFTVNHSENFLNPQDPSIHTQTMECMWGIYKKWKRNSNYSRREYLDYYLAEFVFRKNHKSYSKIQLLDLILGTMKQ